MMSTTRHPARCSLCRHCAWPVPDPSIGCQAADMMKATGLLALIIWVFSATLFYTTEQKEFVAQVPAIYI